MPRVTPDGLQCAPARRTAERGGLSLDGIRDAPPFAAKAPPSVPGAGPPHPTDRCLKLLLDAEFVRPLLKLLDYPFVRHAVEFRLIAVILDNGFAPAHVDFCPPDLRRRLL